MRQAGALFGEPKQYNLPHYRVGSRSRACLVGQPVRFDRLLRLSQWLWQTADGGCPKVKALGKKYNYG